MKVKYMWIPFCLAFLVSMGLKIYQTLTYTDVQTGLESDGGRLTYAVLGALALLVVVLAIMVKSCKKTSTVYTIGTNIAAFFFGAVAGIALVGYAVFGFLGYTGNIHDAYQVTLMVAGACGGVVLILMSISSLIGKNILEKLPLVGVIPTIWVCVRLFVLTFIEYTSISLSSLPSTSTLMSIALIFMLLYFFTYIKLTANQQTDKTFKRLFALGLCASLSLCLYSVSLIITSYMANGRIDYIILLPYIADLSIALYIVCVLVEMTPKLSKKDGSPFVFPGVVDSEPDFPEVKKKEDYEIFEEARAIGSQERVKQQGEKKLEHTITSNTSYFDKLVKVVTENDEDQEDREAVDKQKSTAAQQVVKEETITIDTKAVKEKLEKRNKEKIGVSKPQKIEKPTVEDINRSVEILVPEQESEVEKNKGTHISGEPITMADIDNLIADILKEDLQNSSN